MERSGCPQASNASRKNSGSGTVLACATKTSSLKDDSGPLDAHFSEREVQRVNARTSHASDEVAQHHRDADPNPDTDPGPNADASAA